jgi:hypothetical protein
MNCGEKFCAAQNYSRAAVLSALALRVDAILVMIFATAASGAWLLNCFANGDADGAD